MMGRVLKRFFSRPAGAVGGGSGERVTGKPGFPKSSDADSGSGGTHRTPEEAWGAERLFPGETGRLGRDDPAEGNPWSADPLDPSLTLTRTQHPAIVGNAGN
jgi:hypothetical protein